METRESKSGTPNTSLAQWKQLRQLSSLIFTKYVLQRTPRCLIYTIAYIYKQYSTAQKILNNKIELPKTLKSDLKVIMVIASWYTSIYYLMKLY